MKIIQEELNPEIRYKDLGDGGYSWPEHKYGVLQLLKSNLLPQIPKNRRIRILDLGMGRGGLGYRLLEHNVENIIHGVEVCEPDIKGARYIYDKIFVCDLMEFCRDHLKDSQYDLIVLNDVLEHLEPKDATEILWRILYHQADKIIATPNYVFRQRAREGNPWQQHRSWWDHRFMKSIGAHHGLFTNFGVGLYTFFGSTMPKIEYVQSKFRKKNIADKLIEDNLGEGLWDLHNSELLFSIDAIRKQRRIT